MARGSVRLKPFRRNLMPCYPCQRPPLQPQAAASHAPWQEQLASAAPATLASLLVKSQAKLDRLRYLTATQQQAAAGSLKTLLNRKDHNFAEKFGEYAAWRHEMEQLQKRQAGGHDQDESSEHE